MPHVDITMFPGRDDETKKELAIKVQQFIAQELKIDEKVISVSVEDIAKEEWSKHMERFKEKNMFVHPGV